MIHPGEGDTSTVRSVFIIDPKDKVRLTLTYPKSVGRNFDEILRVIDALQVTDANPVSTPVDWKPGRARHRRPDGLDRRRQGQVRGRRRGQALPAIRQAAVRLFPFPSAAAGAEKAPAARRSRQRILRAMIER